MDSDGAQGANLIEDRRKVVKRAWGLSGRARCQSRDVARQLAPLDSDAGVAKTVIRNQDLGHQREAHVSSKGVKIPAPTVDSSKWCAVEKQAVTQRSG